MPARNGGSTDPAPLIEEFEATLRRAVELRLRSDVPVASYISGGLDSTVILGMCSQQRGTSDTVIYQSGLIGLGPTNELRQPRQRRCWVRLSLQRPSIEPRLLQLIPELVRAAECPVLDTSCAALLRLAESVHDRGYKVVLTGEGADEALAGYVWYKAQAWADAITRRTGGGLLRMIWQPGQSECRRLWCARFRQRFNWRRKAGSTRPVRDDLARETGDLLSRDEEKLAGHDPYSDLDVRTDRIKQWHPLNQSLYTGYKIMLPGMLLLSKGDRIAMNASVETRYPYLDEDVIAFCAGIAPEYKLRGMTEKWILRQVAARILPQADCESTQDDVPRQHGEHVSRTAPAQVG